MVLLSHQGYRSFMLFQRLVRDKELREVLVSSSSRADNYAVVMAVDLVKLRAAIVRIPWHFPKE